MAHLSNGIIAATHLDKTMTTNGNGNDLLSIEAQPYAFQFDPAKTALLIIDMQRDFLIKDGFGYIQAGTAGIDAVQATINPTLSVLSAFRERGMHVIHTREGHRPDLRDLPTPKLLRQARAPKSRHSMVIGDVGPMGRLLTRGEYGHDIIDELQPLTGEYVVDKPGKGSFFSTTLHQHLADRGITHLIVAGVTVECCVTTTVREANDRGFEACILSDCTDGFVPAFKSASLDMVHFSEGLFGFVSSSKPLLLALSSFSDRKGSQVFEWKGSMNIEVLKKAYAAGLSPVDVVKEVLRKIESDNAKHPSIWISLASREGTLSRAEQLEKDRNLDLPLFGIPFAVKDNIDVAGLPTTAACPSFGYTPGISAEVVRRLESAGAVVIGKTNMDQFATGLVGTRSPYGACHCVFSNSHISGGSSSGSAVSVSQGQVSFALGTDTAGSGRVPAAFNNVVGLKPTKGTVSTRGVVPACRTLDCVSFFTQTLTDARTVWLAAKGFDPLDPYARSSLPLAALTNRSLLHKEGTYTFSVPPPDLLNCVLSPSYSKQFDKIYSLLQSLPHAEETTFDWPSYLTASDLVYKGAFVAERAAALSDFLAHADEKGSEILPVISKILDSGLSMSATKTFCDLYEAQRLSRLVEGEFDKCDVLILPTAPNHPTIKEVQEDPFEPNLKLGSFASAVNVLDLAAVAIPAGFIDGLPFGISIVGPAFREGFILEVADKIHALIDRVC
ncbi:glutamyl-tRNA(gln) amidotransferase subunit A, putative [Paecilomyces variotii No. 5]|uniref:Glutamyl-tRNA(Gln) amidotransferase subunit A, putative n=1 Tax=Byssochlamys spectabilis (strain No. 5 / NBRC 109023) TaxID=1356009 RepID=V5G7T3_BYSSN|nr:glutamyl-tRNA(gln) amidotransferase subunit A, putative [Paecilomyces variotii No. 5]